MVVITVLSDVWGLIHKIIIITWPAFIIIDYETYLAKKTNNRLGYSKKISRVFA